MNVVFATGVLVPQQIAGIDYFAGARKEFPDALFPDVPPLGRVSQRAARLASQIAARFPAGGVHIVAHSMAGLDSRFALHHRLSGLDKLVVSLSTMSTPHLGSPVADFLVEPAPSLFHPQRLLYEAIAAAVKAAGYPADATGDLTTKSATALTSQCAEVPGIRYFRYAAAGVFESKFLAVTGLLFNEPNDGLVSVRSALLGDAETSDNVVRTDHIGETGHDLDNLPSLQSNFDHLAFYRRILARAAASAASA
jgi:triacylglycerol lipase